MKAVQARYETRGPVPQDVIGPVTVDLPAPAAGQVLVAVLAAPINPSDVLMLTGGYGMLPPLPAVGGSEGVGRVQEVGPEESGFKAGQLVLLAAGSGTWCSHQLADARRLVPLPDGADPQQMAMLTVNPATASLMLSEFVPLAAGDWVIQNVANSGVGGYLVQLAKQRGLRTVNVVRRDSAVAAVQALGADVVLVDGDDLHKRVREATGGAAIKLGVDAVGGKATDRLARCLGEGGTLRGFWLAKWFGTSSREQQRALYAELTRALATGQLSARVHATYPVERIREAVAAAAAGERDGKILVVPA